MVSIPRDRFAFANMLWEAVLSEETKRAILMVAAMSDEPSLSTIVSCCNVCNAKLLNVAPAFGLLPVTGKRRRWTNTADPDDEPGLLIKGAVEQHAAFVVWRATGGEPLAGVQCVHDRDLAQRDH